MTKLTCFKAYDVRGRIPSELNETLAYQIGQAYAGFCCPPERQNRSGWPWGAIFAPPAPHSPPP